MTRVALVDGIRTPFAKAGTALTPIPAQELARIVIRELIERTEINPQYVNELIFGNISQPMEAANIARVAALTAGLPESLPAYTVCRNCASGLQSITDGFNLIRSGQAHMVIAGGTESMSNTPIVFPKSMAHFLSGLAQAKTLPQKLAALSRVRPKHFKPIFSLVHGLTDPVSGLNMGETAEVLAKKYAITREEQDRFALRSHQLASKAIEEGRMAEEIVPVFFPGKETPLQTDVGPRESQTLEALAKLRPYFDRKYGTVTVGNACPITDGAAAVLLMSEAKVKVAGIEPLAWIRSYGYGGVDPRRMGLGPTVATPLALRRANLSMKDIELMELNEAFAAQVLSCLRIFENPKLGEDVGANQPELGGMHMDRINVNGGAIALGHPVGTSGTRVTLTLAKEMKRRDLTLGLATLCVGGGQGGAIVLERR